MAEPWLTWRTHVFHPLPEKPWTRMDRHEIDQTVEEYPELERYLAAALVWYARDRDTRGVPPCTAEELARYEQFCWERWHVARRRVRRINRIVFAIILTIFLLPTLFLHRVPRTLFFLLVEWAEEAPPETAAPVMGRPLGVGRLVACSSFGPGRVHVTIFPGDPPAVMPGLPSTRRPIVPGSSFWIDTDPPEEASLLSACVANTLRSAPPAAWSAKERKEPIHLTYAF